MTGSAAFYPSGTAPTEWRAGDFLLTRNLASWHSKQGYLSALIRLGEWLHFRKFKQSRPWQWNHAVAVAGSGLIEALGHGVERSPFTKYQPVEFWYVTTDLDDGERADCVAYWESMVGARYGYLTVVSAGFQLVTRLHVGLARTGTVICSGLVAAGLAVYRWRSNPAFVTPAELAIYHNIRSSG